MGWFSKLFGSSDITGSIERVALEWIDTDKETAEAKTMMIKALDPNGKMRRDLSRGVLAMYAAFIGFSSLLIGIEFITAILNIDVNQTAIATATAKLTELFLPITAMMGTIVSASFGVNWQNSRSEKK